MKLISSLRTAWLLLLYYFHVIENDFDWTDSLLKANITLHLQSLFKKYDDSTYQIELLENLLWYWEFRYLLKHIQRLHPKVLIRRIQVLN